MSSTCCCRCDQMADISIENRPTTSPVRILPAVILPPKTHRSGKMKQTIVTLYLKGLQGPAFFNCLSSRLRSAVSKCYPILWALGTVNIEPMRTIRTASERREPWHQQNFYQKTTAFGFVHILYLRFVGWVVPIA